MIQSDQKNAPQKHTLANSQKKLLMHLCHRLLMLAYIKTILLILCKQTHPTLFHLLLFFYIPIFWMPNASIFDKR